MAKSVHSSPARGISFKYAGQHGAVKGRPSLKALLSGDTKAVKRSLNYFPKKDRYTKKTKSRR
jgi:hypothetical protein